MFDYQIKTVPQTDEPFLGGSLSLSDTLTIKDILQNVKDFYGHVQVHIFWEKLPSFSDLYLLKYSIGVKRVFRSLRSLQQTSDIGCQGYIKKFYFFM